jgi:hypothetical protein
VSDQHGSKDDFMATENPLTALSRPARGIDPDELKQQEMIETIAIEGVVGLTAEQLNEVMAVIDMYMADLAERHDAIKGQIADAQARLAGSGDWSNADWWRRVNSAQRIVARLRQRCQIARGKVTRALKQTVHEEQNRRFERLFIEAAKRMLSEEQYKALCQEAKRG